MPLPRFLRAYYAYVFLIDFILGYAIYTAYFSLSGLDVWNIALLFIIWSVMAAIFEVPSGALSDHLDRRWLLVAAPLIKSCTFAVWTLGGGDFWMTAAGFLIWSFSGSLISGSKEALLYEHMEAAGAAEDYDRVLGRDRALQEVAAGIAMVLGGLVGHFSMVAALWLALPPLFAAAIIAIWLPDIRERPDGAEAPHYFTHFITAAREYRASANLRFLTAYLVLGVMLFWVLDEFDPLYYLAVGMPIWSFGLIGAAAIAVLAAANIFAHRLAGFRAGGWLLPLVSGLLLLASGLYNSAWLLIPLMMAYVVAAPVRILGEAKFQRLLEGSSRATTVSALYFFHCLASVAMCLAIGFVASQLGVVAAYGWCGAYLCAIALWGWWRDRHGQSAI